MEYSENARIIYNARAYALSQHFFHLFAEFLFVSLFVVRLYLQLNGHTNNFLAKSGDVSDSVFWIVISVPFILYEIYIYFISKNRDIAFLTGEIVGIKENSFFRNKTVIFKARDFKELTLSGTLKDPAVPHPPQFEAAFRAIPSFFENNKIGDSNTYVIVPEYSFKPKYIVLDTEYDLRKVTVSEFGLLSKSSLQNIFFVTVVVILTFVAVVFIDQF